jgi:hypothetical protein
MDRLKSRLASTDINLIRQDVTPYVRDKKELESGLMIIFFNWLIC